MNRRTLLLIGFIIGLIWSRLLDVFASVSLSHLNKLIKQTEEDQSGPSRIRYARYDDPLSQRPPTYRRPNAYGRY